MPRTSCESSSPCTRSALLVTGFEIELVEANPGLIVLRALGPRADAFFADEAGGHRWQRVPPGDKRGSGRTATVTVLVRSKHQNLATALALLRARLWRAEKETIDVARARDRREQLGSGMRGDKRRTIRAQDGQVTDHVTGRRWSLKEYLRGEW
jgi:peptide chain release factor 1